MALQIDSEIALQAVLLMTLLTSGFTVAMCVFLRRREGS